MLIFLALSSLAVSALQQEQAYTTEIHNGAGRKPGEWARGKVGTQDALMDAAGRALHEVIRGCLRADNGRCSPMSWLDAVLLCIAMCVDMCMGMWCLNMRMDMCTSIWTRVWTCA